ncbi:MAG TPA: transcriptional regulator NrdR [Chloroflexota bacterium]|nr:transcriptional regulator NrdR [Chloroflexota bacterium]
MRCPHCGHLNTKVIETRESDEAVRRRRQCEACRLRFTTYERTQLPRLVIRATSGSQRNFTRQWLANALQAAGADLPPPTLNTIASSIEAQLKATNRRVASTADVAHLAIREVTQARPFSAAPTTDQVTAALDATLPKPRSAPSQLSLELSSSP